MFRGTLVGIPPAFRGTLEGIPPAPAAHLCQEKKMRVGKSLVHEHFPRQEITDAEASSGVKVKIKCKYCQKTLYHANCEDLKSHLRREHNQGFLEVEKGDENALEELKKRLYAASDNITSQAEITESFFYKFLFGSGVAVSTLLTDST